MPYIHEYTNLNPKELRQLRYKRQYKNDVPAWDDSMVLLTNLVRDRLLPNASVLDLGCGHGNFVIDELGDVFGRKVGMDISPETTAGNVSVSEIVHGNIEKLPFPEASFDVVLSLWVLEHLADPTRVFAEVARVLKPNGFFAFVTPNRASLLIAVRRMMNKRFADKLLLRVYGREEDDVFDVHYRANTPTDIKNACAGAGLKAETLQQNADPSYTSFGATSYQLSRAFSGIKRNLAGEPIPNHRSWKLCRGRIWCLAHPAGERETLSVWR